jgi:hypothetical protein
VTWSIVRTCSRCGTRAEAAICSRDDVVAYMHAMMLFLTGRDVGEGCPSCTPELAQALEARGHTPDEWRAAVERARGRRPV